jgi:competence protein ComEC
MSFGAVAAMMALVPFMHRRAMEGPPHGMIDRALVWIGRAMLGLLTTTLVASIATAPFAAYHFQALNPYGLVGNALALPLVSLVVMPAAVLGVLAYPFGLDRPVWQLMGAAVSQVLEVSAWVGGFNGSTVIVPAMGAGALAFLSLAILVLTIPASSLRWVALLPAGAGLALAAAPHGPDIYIDRQGAGAAVRSAAGRLALVGRPSSFVIEQWLRADGDGRRADDGSLRRDARCDRIGCVVEARGGRRVAFVQDDAAFEEDCRRASIVITGLKAPPRCDAALVLDRDALAARGATALGLGDEGIELRSVLKGRETFAWSGAGSAGTETSPAREGPRQAQPVPEQDVPEEEASSGEPD